jgi:hypothetical protein
MSPSLPEAPCDCVGVCLCVAYCLLHIAILYISISFNFDISSLTCFYIFADYYLDIHAAWVRTVLAIAEPFLLKTQ